MCVNPLDITTSKKGKFFTLFPVFRSTICRSKWNATKWFAFVSVTYDANKLTKQITEKCILKDVENATALSACQPDTLGSLHWMCALSDTCVNYLHLWDCGIIFVFYSSSLLDFYPSISLSFSLSLSVFLILWQNGEHKMWLIQAIVNKFWHSTPGLQNTYQLDVECNS